MRGVGVCVGLVRVSVPSWSWRWVCRATAEEQTRSAGDHGSWGLGRQVEVVARRASEEDLTRPVRGGELVGVVVGGELAVKPSMQARCPSSTPLSSMRRDTTWRAAARGGANSLD